MKIRFTWKRSSPAIRKSRLDCFAGARLLWPTIARIEPATPANAPGGISDMNSVSAIPRRVLGRTALDVSILGFGSAPLGDLYARLDDATAIAAVEHAFNLGINLVDTSPLYGHGLSEHRCGTAIRRVPRQDIIVCTKVGRWMDPFHRRATGSGYVGGHPHRAVFDYSYDGTMRSVEQS